MGGTYWSDDHYRERASFLRRAGKSAFEYHDLEHAAARSTTAGCTTR